MARWGLLVLVLVLVAVPVHAKDTVVIYTALEPEQITDYMKAVNKTLPNLEVKMLRLSTGDISARFMAAVAVLLLDDAGESAQATAMSVLIIGLGLLVRLLYWALLRGVTRRTQAWTTATSAASGPA